MRKMWLLLLAAIAVGALVAADVPRCLATAPTAQAKDDWTGPKMVLIIRHAEKPETAGDPNLSQKGFERADALAHVIPDHFVKPDFLIATKKSKGSARPIETITPLSKAIDEPIQSKFADEEIAAVANDVLTNPKYRGKIVLIAWHHGKIPDLAKALGATDAPKEWNSKVFDRVWQLTFTGDAVQFTNLPQKALPGDSDQ
jgi:phosphohistidine phosphatase SixA